MLSVINKYYSIKKKQQKNQPLLISNQFSFCLNNKFNCAVFFIFFDLVIFCLSLNSGNKRTYCLIRLALNGGQLEKSVKQ